MAAFLIERRGDPAAGEKGKCSTAKLTVLISLFIAPVSSPGPGLLTGAIKNEINTVSFSVGGIEVVWSLSTPW
jgi:hypothetical protein